MNTIDPSSLLLQMRVLAARAQGVAEVPAAEAAEGSFRTLLAAAVHDVNQNQQAARGLAEGFEKGDPNVDISEVMIAVQKANVSFQAITQVRNKLVAAYQDIMNMPI